MKKILVILGGGRPNGNTVQLVSEFIKGAADAGHQAELLSLNNMNLENIYMQRFNRYNQNKRINDNCTKGAAFWGKRVAERLRTAPSHPRAARWHPLQPEKQSLFRI